MQTLQDIKANAPGSQAPAVGPGGFFRVNAKSHFAHGEIHQAKRIRREKLGGCDGELDLGVMVEFVIEDYFGRPFISNAPKITAAANISVTVAHADLEAARALLRKAGSEGDTK